MHMGFIGFGMIELLFMFFFATPAGLPPGDRDDSLIHAAPKTALLYVEWSERAAGQTGAKGVDGWAADPETIELLQSLEKKLIQNLKERGGDEGELMANHLPVIWRAVLTRPGCLWFDVDQKKLVGPGDQVGRPDQMVEALRFALIINGGDAADALHESILAVMKQIPGLDAPDRLDRFELPLPIPNVSLIAHKEASYLILAFGNESLETTLAGLSGKSQGLTDNDRYKKTMVKLEGKRIAGLHWIDVKQILDLARATVGRNNNRLQESLKSFGFDGVTAFAGCTVVEEGRIVSRTGLETGGTLSGFLSLFAGRPLKESDFEHIPADADFVVAATLPIPVIVDQFAIALTAIDPFIREEIQREVKQLEESWGISFDKDVLPAFGETWTLYNAPHTGALLTGTVLSLEIKDSNLADATLKKITDHLTQQLGADQNQYLDRYEFGRQTIYTIGHRWGGLNISWCLTESHLVFALHPQAIKAHLRFADSRNPRFSTRVEKIQSLKGTESLVWAYIDSPEYVRLLGSLIPFIGQEIAREMNFGFRNPEGNPDQVFHIGTIPSLGSILPYVQNSTARLIRTKTGLQWEVRDGLPVPFLSSAPMLVPFVGIGTLRALEVRGGAPAQFDAVPADAAKEAPAEIEESVPEKEPLEDNGGELKPDDSDAQPKSPANEEEPAESM